MAFIIKSRRGDIIHHPKAFLSSTLHHKYNDMLRDKYRSKITTYEYLDNLTDDDEDDVAALSEEYASVRREIGRLIRIYREVTIRYYVHGESVAEIASKLNISIGTVMSRLSGARSQIKEKLQTMEKYSEFSYAPKTISLGIWGNSGLSGEPFSLIHSPLEANILVLAYENPASIKGIADTIGMPCAYIEPVVDSLVNGELLGRTKRGLIYTRCHMQKYEDAFGDIPMQEAVADQYAEQVWNVAWKHLKPLTQREAFQEMNEKQKATMILFSLHQVLSKCVQYSKPQFEGEPKSPPERLNGGKWLASATIYENDQPRDNIYETSGPVLVNYCADNDGENTCQMYDCQSLFGDAHWAYSKFKYKVSLQTILRFYASLLPCDVTPDNHMIYELIPELEKLHILRRDEDGKATLDIPALPFDEVKIWNPAIMAITKELQDVLGDELIKIWQNRKNKVPKHIDCPEHFTHASALGAYQMAQLVAIVKKGLMPYHVDIGKTPLIYIAYRKNN